MADFDRRLAEALENDEAFQGLLQQLKEAATAEVTIYDREPCPKGCGCKHFRQVKVPDYNTKLKIMEFLANRGVGRPAQASGEDSQGITFERVVYLTDADAA